MTPNTVHSNFVLTAIYHIHTKKKTKKFGRIKENVEYKRMIKQKSLSNRKGFCLYV